MFWMTEALEKNRRELIISNLGRLDSRVKNKVEDRANKMALCSTAMII